MRYLGHLHYGKRNTLYVGLSFFRFPIGILLDFHPPVADRYKRLEFSFGLGFFHFYWIWYTTDRYGFIGGRRGRN